MKKVIVTAGSWHIGDLAFAKGAEIKDAELAKKALVDGAAEEVGAKEEEAEGQPAPKKGKK